MIPQLDDGRRPNRRPACGGSRGLSEMRVPYTAPEFERCPCCGSRTLESYRPVVRQPRSWGSADASDVSVVLGSGRLATRPLRRIFLCPNCEGKIRIPPSYELTLGILALGVNVTLVYILGFRGAWLVICVAGLYLPLNWVVGVLFAAVVPPRLQPSGSTSLSTSGAGVRIPTGVPQAPGQRESSSRYSRPSGPSCGT